MLYAHAGVNVYAPDDLADEVRPADLNVSAITQQALRAALASGRVEALLRGVSRLYRDGRITARQVGTRLA